MSNISYCRFENTSHDLQDCLEHINDNDLSEEENESRIKLTKICKEILDKQEIADDLQDA